ncbi:hypothetical protein AM228_21300 [Planktothricoides sp. SR001]|uniref:hypothetical protein n=1 Tax=Planktothricoides sp. SR001 TaxID=1705388 RepID=UPI0006C3F3F8|nr:hypothetical protein [Planktothricoides sp. SR001]KOR34949.1 hypothetical protein AM228_21300 [Planktothricoides sp. SR001]
MFDLNNIDIIKTDEQRNHSQYSFVGLQRNQESNRLEFWLPLGFDDFDDKDFNLVKEFFFKMYRTFKIYRQKKQNDLEKEYITSYRDGIIEAEKGFSFINENNEQVIFYGKLNSLDKILEGYDELRISSLGKKQMSSPEIDYSKIYRYMHQGIYLDEDVIYIDEMNIAKNILIKESPPILQMFGFIYTEIKKELEELEQIPDRAVELADQFKENYLQPDSSLFGEDTFAETIEILRKTLEDIDLKTTYKDEDYWHFFEAVEAFLYGERQEDDQGIYWGFSNFYDIWEDMCQTYVLNTPEYRQRAVFADVGGKLKLFLNYHDINPFKVELNDLPEPRYLRPDLVLKTSVSKIDQYYLVDEKLSNEAEVAVKLNLRAVKDHPKIQSEYKELSYKTSVINTTDKLGSGYKYMSQKKFSDFKNFVKQYFEESSASVQIIDYKYMRVSDYEKYSPNKPGENKVKDDIQKQLVYEWTVQKNWKVKTESEFWIPYFSNSEFEKIENVKNTCFQQSQIKLVKINFTTLQDFYIKQQLV